MKKLSMLGSLTALLLMVGNAPQAAAEVAKLPPSGTTHFTTYFAVHPAHELKMVDDSSITVAELVGITRNPDGEPYFDNLVVRCLVSIRVVKGEPDLYGACRETDQDGDYTSTTFDSKAHYFIGGTGKYKGITGTAPFTVQDLCHRMKGSMRSSSRMRSPGRSSEPKRRGLRARDRNRR